MRSRLLEPQGTTAGPAGEAARLPLSAARFFSAGADTWESGAERWRFLPVGSDVRCTEALRPLVLAILASVLTCKLGKQCRHCQSGVRKLLGAGAA